MPTNKAFQLDTQTQREIDSDLFDFINRGDDDLLFGGSTEAELSAFAPEINANDTIRFGAFNAGIAAANIATQSNRSTRFDRLNTVLNRDLERRRVNNQTLTAQANAGLANANTAGQLIDNSFQSQTQGSRASLLESQAGSAASDARVNRQTEQAQISKFESEAQTAAADADSRARLNNSTINQRNASADFARAQISQVDANIDQQKQLLEGKVRAGVASADNLEAEAAMNELKSVMSQAQWQNRQNLSTSIQNSVNFRAGELRRQYIANGDDDKTAGMKVGRYIRSTVTLLHAAEGNVDGMTFGALVNSAVRGPIDPITGDLQDPALARVQATSAESPNVDDGSSGAISTGLPTSTAASDADEAGS